jgi:hypothetical protein
MSKKKELGPRQLNLVESVSLDIIQNPCEPKSHSIGYVARFLSQFGMPHRPVEGNTFKRVNGDATLLIVSNSNKGIASGSIPRLVMGWVGTWQVRHPNAEIIELGKNLSRFLTDDLGLHRTGGPRGYITRVKNETFKLFTSSISITAEQRGGLAFEGSGPLARKMELWHNPDAPDQDALFDSYIVLNRDFREELIEHPIPIDWRAMPALTPSPLAMDYYFWLAHRLHRIVTPQLVTWAQLHMQFGAQYDWTDKRRRFDFRLESEKQLANRVLKVYPQARLKMQENGLLLFKSDPPVPLTTKMTFLPPNK